MSVVSGPLSVAQVVQNIQSSGFAGLIKTVGRVSVPADFPSTTRRKISLNPPLRKGDFFVESGDFLPFEKGGVRGDFFGPALRSTLPISNF